MSEINKKLDDPYTKLWSSKCSFPVRYADLDTNNHVNNCVYFVWFQEARVNFFTELVMLEGEVFQLGWVVAETNCKYIKPVFFPDTVTVYCRLKSRGKSSFTMELVLVSDQQNTICAAGEARLVCFNTKANKKGDIPQVMFEAFDKLEEQNKFLLPTKKSKL